MSVTVSMLPRHTLLLFVLFASSLTSCVQSQLNHSCTNDFSFIGMSMVANITFCKKLPTLGFEFGWNYRNTTTNVTVDVIFSAKPPTGGWVAWGVNPGPRPQMVGTRALIAFVQQKTRTPVVYTYNVTSDNKAGCSLKPTQLELEVSNMRANYSAETGVITVAARLNLPPSVYNISRLNHVWQLGPWVVGDTIPVVHAKRLHNFDSRETINLISGHAIGYRTARLRVAHGVLGAIGWGFLLPSGVIIARYFKSFPFPLERWFLVHVGFQIAAFTIGTVAWGIGLSMVYHSEHFRSFMAHRIIGILVFSLASLQIMALWLKPNKMDKYRKYWCIYHHFVGYSLIAFTITNILIGFSILMPPSRWRWAYIGILIGLSCTALGLEIATWVKFCWNPKKDNKIAAPIKP